MEKTLEILKKTKFPIQVTSAHLKNELENWRKDFENKGIQTTFKAKNNNKFELWREITDEEKSLILAGKLRIRLASFITQKDWME